MTRCTCASRGFLLTELMAVLALSVLLLGILGKLVVDVIYLQRIAVQHADRVAVMDALTERIRADTRTAADSDWREHTLTLRTLGPAGPTDVTYIFEPATVWRQTAGEAATQWRSLRLKFSCRVEPGPRARVLMLEFIEQPPPRATALPNRNYPVAFLLPPPSGQADALHKEGGP